MIVVKPNGGLGNRMRVIHSAFLLSKLKRQKRIVILWKKDAGLNAGFTQLFKPLSNCFMTENLAVSSALFYTSKIVGYTYIGDETAQRHRFDLDFWKSTRHNLLINSCMDFIDNQQPQNNYSIFQPIDTIRNKVDRITKQFSLHTIGVQIRRTDNRPSIAKSPTGNFITQMETLIMENPETNFYLSTDDQELEINLQTHFPHRIIIQSHKEFSRNSLVGINAALIDMYSLSATKFILGSYNSSFGEVAASIGNIPFRVVKDLNA